MILKQIEDAGFAKGNQSVDATHVIANIAIPGTIGLIRQGIKAIMEEIETVDPKLFEELGGKKTADKKEKLHTLKPEEKKTKLVDVVEEARTIRDKAEKLESPSVKQKTVLSRKRSEEILTMEVPKIGFRCYKEELRSLLRYKKISIQQGFYPRKNSLWIKLG